MMLILQKIITNGFIPIIPVLIWNIIFASRLPEAFGPGNFDLNIPRPILKAEGIFRIIVFVLPLFMEIDVSTKAGRAGLVIYAAGSLLYYLSWLMLMYAPASIWSVSAAGFTAPSYTPIIWFTGISMMADSYYFNFSYSVWHLIVPCALFSAFHIAHTSLVFRRSSSE